MFCEENVVNLHQKPKYLYEKTTDIPCIISADCLLPIAL